jgi:hypothetical protein
MTCPTTESIKDALRAWGFAFEREYCVGAAESQEMYAEIDQLCAAVDALLEAGDALAVQVRRFGELLTDELVRSDEQEDAIDAWEQAKEGVR